MKRRVVALAVAGLAGLMGTSALAAAPSAYQRPGTNTLASVSSNGGQGNDFSGRPEISADGRFVAFESLASNLVPGDTNQMIDVFVRDRRGGGTTRVSVASDGSQALGLPNATNTGFRSGYPSISADGRYVAFSSTAINLVPGDTNAANDIFVHDRKTGKTIRVSVASNGAQANAASSQETSISADGRYVAFSSAADNLVPGDTNKSWDVFIRDLWTHRTVRASVTASGAQADYLSVLPSLSANGRFVAFFSFATNLIPEAPDLVGVVVKDMKTGKLVQASVASDGSQPTYGPLTKCVVRTPGLGLPLPSPAKELTSGTNNYFCGAYLGKHAISDDGRYVVFVSDAQNLVPNDTNYNPTQGVSGVAGTSSGYDIFVRDLWAGRTERVSVDSVGHERDDVSGSDSIFPPSISGDGRTVSYANETSTLYCASVLRGTGLDLCAGRADLFLYDRVSGAMEQASVSASGGAPSPGSCAPTEWVTGLETPRAYYGTLSRDGRYTTYYSSSPNLVTGDRNKVCDVFVRDRGPRVGTGGFDGVGSDSVPGQAPTCVTNDLCLPPSPGQLPTAESGSALEPGADLTGARANYRPGTRDLLVRWDVARLPTVSGAAAAGPLYEMTLTVGGVRFQVRAQRVPGADFDSKGGASFGLFRQTSPGSWEKVASLEGGYGTIGDAVVTAVPLSLLGGTAQLTDVTAYTAVGTYLGGATTVLDSLRLTSAAGGR